MPDSGSFAALVAAIHAEIAALEAEDADAIQAATSVKQAALDDVAAAVAAGVEPDRDLLEQARTLNAEAMLKSRAKMISVERRLAAVTPPAVRREALVYGPDGRWA